jgi:hypothetical protein
MNSTLTSDLVTSKPKVVNAPKPSLEEFKFERPPLFPGFSELVSPEVLPPSGISSLVTDPADLAPVESDSLTLSRAMTRVDASEPKVADDMIPGGRLDNAREAAEVAAITRDQIRWEPRAAVMAQANSSPADVLAVLQ